MNAIPPAALQAAQDESNTELLETQVHSADRTVERILAAAAPHFDRQTTTSDLWQHVRNVLAWVDEANARTEHEVAMRLLKLVEEAGEVASAYIGMTGQNPRKGITHTHHDVAGELCDVVVTALVALATITGDIGAARIALAQHLAQRGPRLAVLTEGASA
ncbi:MazG-like family protein [Nonomuraea zeae]|uniref:NTP pyrophosphohydrolase MazG putative catalytic core domain-containing protein n=1 Tax=Nonomuraea zeae TaxID=1642303 RepID=A0A5S4H4I4_9ACTN|nr:MazG-like family protein [Nonomuraea zeae]TMR39621.1 hypothetical protein ETD85_01000 [Nonomuraea zeae]